MFYGRTSAVGQPDGGPSRLVAWQVYRKTLKRSCHRELNRVWNAPGYVAQWRALGTQTWEEQTITATDWPSRYAVLQSPPGWEVGVPT